MRKKYSLLLILLMVISFIPFPTVLVPEWRIQVVDENGVPYQGKLVRQFCKNYTLGIDPCLRDDAYQLTDENGYVVFPERRITASLLSRFFRSIYNFLNLLVHGSVGVDIHLDSSGPQGYKLLEYKPGEPLPEKFILPSEPLKETNEKGNFPNPFRE